MSAAASPARPLTAARRFPSAIPCEWEACAQCGDSIPPRARHTRSDGRGEYVCSARCARERHAQLTWEGR